MDEFSQYDAGWLHLLKSTNEGDLRRANWGDLNYPARIPTLMAAGVPMIQYDNPQAVVATQSLAREHGIGLFLTDSEQLAAELREEKAMAQLRDNVWRQRQQFSFDAHADRLIDFFRRVIGDERGHSS